jgi:aspartyl/asparaginyl beta-hydroxylase (cupin superfamily)
MNKLLQNDNFTDIQNTSFVSLGTSCCVALSLKSLNLKKHTFPFDWNPNVLKIVIDCLQTNFENYKILGKYEIKNNFNDELYKFKNIVDLDFDINYINYYCNWFPHDIHLSTQELINQITRRCDRLLNLLKSDKPIIFIYTNEEAIWIKEYKSEK